jgi:AcrR family transcriptional regulator
MTDRVATGLTKGDRSGHRSGPRRPARSRMEQPGQAESGSRAGFHPPQQARSRAALQRLLASAEHVLVNDGLEELTIARVADHAGVSVGGVYRRFAGKEQLIDAVKQALVERLEQSVSTALDRAAPSLGGVLDVFTTALAETLDESGRLIPAMLAGGRSAEPPEQGLRTLTSLQQQFIDAVAPHRDQIRHPDPEAALNIAFRCVIATAAHRAAIAPWLPDGLTWQQWAREIAHMTNAYLTAER